MAVRDPPNHVKTERLCHTSRQTFTWQSVVVKEPGRGADSKKNMQTVIIVHVCVLRTANQITVCTHEPIKLWGLHAPLDRSDHIVKCAFHNQSDC